MKKHEIKVGGHYIARVSGKLVTVRVDGMRTGINLLSSVGTHYDVTNLSTGRTLTFRSAQKFRSEVKEDEQRSDPCDSTRGHISETEQRQVERQTFCRR